MTERISNLVVPLAKATAMRITDTSGLDTHDRSGAVSLLIDSSRILIMPNLRNTKHGQHGTLTYSRWKSMRQRCIDKNAENYKYYGGRGITICQQWLDSFSTFLEDMGECPIGMTLERLNSEIGYRPDNCIWAEMAVQNKNRSACVPLTFNGRTMNVTDWAHEVGMSPNALLQRLYLGWSIERALTTPLKKRTVK